jgi:endo-alpha-1,4-polygalactosaminidase (GH114 family)
MREYAIARNPEFVIIQQNAAPVMDGYPELLDTTYANAYAKGYVPYVTRRSLSRLTATPPPSYWPGSDVFRHIQGATCNE